jgi:peptide/nickel transport system permease protein
MVKFLLGRIAAGIGVLFALLFVLFVLQNFTPVNPVKVLLGPQASQTAQAAAKRRLGLDDPMWKRYLRYVWDALHGNFGTSTRTSTPVGHDLRALAPASIELMLFSALLVVLGALLLAYLSAARWPGAAALRAVMTAFASAGRTSWGPEANGPTGLITVDAVFHGRFDIWWDAVEHLLLPGLCIAICSAVAVGRVLRGGLLDTLSVPYTRTAFAKGLSRRQVLIRHSTRNSLNAALSMLGLQFGVMVASQVIVEQVFSWPGIGSYLAQSIPANDFPAIAAVTLILGVIYIVVNIVVDLCQAWADPRIVR